MSGSPVAELFGAVPVSWPAVRKQHVMHLHRKPIILGESLLQTHKHCVVFPVIVIKSPEAS